MAAETFRKKVATETFRNRKGGSRDVKKKKKKKKKGQQLYLNASIA